MNQNLIFSFIGGDPRQIRVITGFAQDGYLVQTFGMETAVFPNNLAIKKCSSLSECLNEADIVVLPFPYSSGQETIKAPFSQSEIYTNDVLKQMEKRQLLLVGRADVQLKNLADLYNIHYIDYGEREEFLILNTIPTVEGALEIAMRETTNTIHGSHCLVLGYGRIGKLLSHHLQKLGAMTSVVARKQRDLAWIQANACKPIPFADLQQHIEDYDIIFNTIPTMVLDFKLLSKMKDSVLIIDLASKPGGVDFETADMLEKKVIWALSLPGKTAPDTAGSIIQTTITNILTELGV